MENNSLVVCDGGDVEMLKLRHLNALDDCDFDNPPPSTLGGKPGPRPASGREPIRSRADSVRPPAPGDQITVKIKTAATRSALKWAKRHPRKSTGAGIQPTKDQLLAISYILSFNAGKCKANYDSALAYATK